MDTHSREAENMPISQVTFTVINQYQDAHTYDIRHTPDHSMHTVIKFMKKDAEGNVEDGVTNEDIVAMLIHRINRLNEMFPCRENSLAITKLEEALMWLDARTKNREARGVEGKHEV